MKEIIKLLAVYGLPLIVLAFSIRSHLLAKIFARNVQKNADAFNQKLLAQDIDPSYLDASFVNHKK